MDYHIFYVIAVTLVVTLHLQINPEATIGADCEEDGNCTDTETCNATKCECNSDSYESGDQCVSKSVHGEECTGKSQCQDELRCYSQKCGCANGTVYDGSRCVSNSILVPVIKDNTSTYNMFTVTWTRGNDSYGYTSTYDMKYNGEVMHNVDGSSSPQTTQSPTNLTSNTYYNVSIRRHIRYNSVEQAILESTPPYKIKTKSVHGEECTDNSQCQDELRCYNQKCGCANGTVYNGSRCVSNSILVPVITANTSTYNMFTVSWTRGHDSYGYTSTYDMKYNDEVVHDVDGSSSPQTTQSPTDLTSNTYYNVSIRRHIRYNSVEQAILESTPPYSIKTKSSHKQTCTGNNDCAKFPDSSPGLICYTGGSSSVCLCPDNYYYKQALQCLQMSGLNPSFSLSSDLTSITVNLTNKPVAGSLYTSTYSAQLNPGGVHNLSSTVTGIPGLKEGTVYSVTVTRTLTLKDVGRVKITSPPAQNYSTKVSYNSTCSSNGVCIDINTDCHGRKCLCNPTYYWRNVSCRPTSELRPQSVQADILNTTSVTVSWSPPNHSHFVSAYHVNATPKDSNVTVPPAVEVTGGGSSSTTLTGLQPGTEYRFSVESKSTNDGRVEYVPGNPVDKVTRPATIDKLDELHSNFSAPIMKVAFPPAKQTFLYYTVTLKGDDGYDQQVNTIHHTDGYYYAEFGGITPGKYYTIEVVTISVQNSQSEPFTDRRRAMVAQASEVVGLRNGNLTSRSVIINWERPEIPNGDLFEYSLEISQDDDCISRIIFNCTECPRNKTEFQGTARSCLKLTTVNITENNIKNDTYVVWYNVTSLDPDTNYNIQAVAYNADGRGKGSTPLQIHTHSEPARKPKAVSISSLASNTVTVNWIPQTPRPGKTSYVVGVQERNIDNVDFTWIKNVTLLGYDSNTFEVSDLSSYWEYQFNVQSQSEVPPTSEFFPTGAIRTLESVPTQVVDLEASEVPGFLNKVRLSWKCPPQKDGRNGIIRRATVRYETESLHESVIPKSGEKVYESTESCSWDVQIDVTAGFNYTFIVFISNSFEGAQRVIHKYVPEGPPSLNVGSTALIQIISGGVSESNVAVDVCAVCLFNNQNGAVVRTGLLVCMLGHCPITGPSTKGLSYYDSLPNWDKAKGVAFTSMYRATDNEWMDGVQQSLSHRFILGGEDCRSVADQTRYCNGPLPKDTYRMWLFACTNVGCTEGSHLEFTLENTDKSLSATTVGAIVASILAVIIVAIMVAIYIKVIRPRSKRQRGTRYVPDTSPKDDTYAEIDGGNRMSVIQDGRSEMDYYNTRDSPSGSENTYDQLKVYNNEGCHDYGQIKVTRN